MLLIMVVNLWIVALRRLDLLSFYTIRFLLLFVLSFCVIAAFKLLHLVLRHLTETLRCVSFTSIVTWYKTSIIGFTLICGTRRDCSLRSMRLLCCSFFGIWKYTFIIQGTTGIIHALIQTIILVFRGSLVFSCRGNCIQLNLLLHFFIFHHSFLLLMRTNFIGASGDIIEDRICTIWRSICLATWMAWSWRGSLTAIRMPLIIFESTNIAQIKRLSASKLILFISCDSN